MTAAKRDRKQEGMIDRWRQMTTPLTKEEIKRAEGLADIPAIKRLKKGK
jgi:hypothetical protein